MRLNIFPWQSLKTKVTFATLAIFVASILALGYYTSRMLREDMQRLLGEQQFSTVSLLAAQVNDEIDGRLRALESVAASVPPAILGKSAALQALLEQRPIVQVLFNGGVIAVDPDGTVIASVPSLPKRTDRNYMDRDYVVGALKEGKSTIGRPAMSKAQKAPTINIGVPIRDAHGKVIGALGGEVNLAKPNFLGRIVKGRYGKTGKYYVVARQQRLIVTSSDTSRVMETLPPPGISLAADSAIQGDVKSVVYRNPLGVEVLGSAKGVPVANWYVGITTPTEEAFAPIQDMQRRMLLAAVLLALLAGALTWWMLRRQLAPMLTTAKTLAALAHTDQIPEPFNIARQDEIGDLLGGFNHLLKTLAQREKALWESEARNRAIAQSAHDAIITSDSAGNIVGWNHGAETIFGYTESEVIGRPMTLLIPERHRGAHLAGMNRLRSGGEYLVIGKTVELHGLRKDENELPLELSLAKWEATDGWFITGIIRDITERKQAEEMLRQSNEKYRRMFEDAAIGVFRSIDDRFTDVNPALARMLGYDSPQEVISSIVSISKQIYVDPPKRTDIVAAALAKGEAIIAENRYRRKDGAIWFGNIILRSVTDAQGQPQYLEGFVEDITKRKQMEEQIWLLAFHDTLTKLPNRRLLNDRLNQTMAANKRSGCHGAMMFLDLDNFKVLNDTHGHEAGDLLLIEAAERLISCVREVDTVARFGGDEFVVMISELDADISTAQAGIIAEKIRAILAKPYVLQIRHEGEAETTIEHQCTASIGVTLFGKNGASADDILKWADRAMYQAKEAGCNLIRYFDSHV